ncbi:MAG: NADP-dependent phosphogluconate dehydrogenase [Rubellimicrobium sp.]|nr:NADP-dependent phosphogluconate dehydrogenase [Rubellimicrobium sp.]
MEKARIGLVGLGTMGAALAANIAEKGFTVAVWNRRPEVTRDFKANAGALAANIIACETLPDLVEAIRPPRPIILMIPAGDPVDEQSAALRPLLDAGDIIIDAGNANFHDTNRRMAEDHGGVRFLGMGVSGGEEGARHGPSIMGGGARADWDSVADVMQAIAAKAEDGTPCAAWMGEGGAGHFVKSVHNGIEYADMQMIAEVYGIMRDGMGWDAGRVGDTFTAWNGGVLRSFLIEIAGTVAHTADPETGQPILDVITDAAGQKGTGRWTAIEAQHLAAPIPVIEAAVMARNVSARRAERASGEARFGRAPQPVQMPPDDLEQALIAGKILCYAQGFAMIRAAGDAFGWTLDLPEIARVWRAGCIIRSDMLGDMAAALEQDGTRNLIFAPFFAGHLETALPALRRVVTGGIAAGHALPALSSGLAWFDLMRTARGTANMIQGLRDFFGWHGFDRLDGRDSHHGPWAVR